MSVQTTWILGLADDDQHHRQTDVAANNIYTTINTTERTLILSTLGLGPPVFAVDRCHWVWFSIAFSAVLILTWDSFSNENVV